MTPRTGRPWAAGTAMGIMIGIALGVSGVLAAAVPGWIVDSFGFGVHYVVLAVICLVGLLPLARMTETVAVATGTGTETMKK